jgi:hypothetical protein
MRGKLTGVLLAAVMVAALSGIATSAASAAVFTLAATTCTGGTFKNLCWSNAGVLQELTGEQTFAVKQIGKGLLKGIIGGEEVTVECTETTVGAAVPPVIVQTSPLTENGKIKGTLVFKGCKVTGNATVLKKCKIPVEKESLSLLGELTEVNATKATLHLTPASGTEFIVIPFENNGTETCPATIKGNRAVTGSQDITVEKPEEHTTTKTGKTVVKSGLKLAGEPAELTATLEISLTGLGDEWDLSATV